MKLLLLFSCVLICSCSSSGVRESGFEVANFMQGLMRPDEHGRWRVYEEGNNFALVPNGQCTVAGVKKACFWYGIEFNFENASEGLQLECVAKTKRPTDLVTPVAVEARQVTEATFTMSLDGARGHASYPGYMVPDGEVVTNTQDVSCTYNRRPAISFSSQLMVRPSRYQL